MNKKLILLIITILLLSSSAFAKNLSLKWDTNNDADYYIVYWGPESRNYTFFSENIDDPTTEYTATDLTENENWYFAVKAFNSCGNSSDFSEEITSNGEETDPEPQDSDGDGLPDSLEFIIGTNPYSRDTDVDGIEDGDEYLNYSDDIKNGIEDMPDFDGDGIPDIIDTDDDDDGISDLDEITNGTSQYFNEVYSFIDMIIINEKHYLLKTDLVTKAPMVVAYTEGESSYVKGKELSLSDSNYWAIGISGDFGDLDGIDGHEVAIWIRNKTTGQDSIITIDIESGKVYGSETTTTEEEEVVTETQTETLTELNTKGMAIFNNGDLAVLWYSTVENQTKVRIFTSGETAYTFVKDINFLNPGIEALRIEIKDINNDGEEEIIVTAKPVVETRTIKKVTGVTVTPVQ